MIIIQQTHKRIMPPNTILLRLIISMIYKYPLTTLYKNIRVNSEHGVMVHECEFNNP